MDIRCFADNLRAARSSRGLRQKDVAGALHVTPQTISKWEKGLALPDTENLLALSAMLGVSLNALFADVPVENGRAYLAVDGGGSKTVFVRFTEDGTVTDVISLGASNPNVVGDEAALSVLKHGVDLVSAHRPSFCALFAGVSGCGLASKAIAVQKGLQQAYPDVKVFVDTDVRNVLHSVRGLRRCAVVIAGTGSSVFAWNGSTLDRFGGFGYLFDCVGSGYDVGRDAVRLTLTAENRLRKDGAALASEIERAFGGRLIDDLARFYERDRTYIASFAPVVFRCAADGDENAVAIIENNAAGLARVIERARSVADCGETVLLSGGLANEPLFVAALERNLAAGTRLIRVEAPQVYGAALRVLELTDTAVDEKAFDERFFATFSDLINKEKE
ncbi:MAG: XRE family transcriptional regulator [Eubacteriales bacterium]|nr:XRE family transcriptional regulator [Eubacteriales bacterium]